MGSLRCGMLFCRARAQAEVPQGVQMLDLSVRPERNADVAKTSKDVR